MTIQIVNLTMPASSQPQHCTVQQQQVFAQDAVALEHQQPLLVRPSHQHTPCLNQQQLAPAMVVPSSHPTQARNWSNAGPRYTPPVGTTGEMKTTNQIGSTGIPAPVVVTEFRDDSLGRPFTAEHDITEQDDAQSDISPLQCGSILPNPRYDASQDPVGKPFMPPLEISVLSKRRPSDADADEDGSDPPEWLALPHVERPSQQRRRSLSPDNKIRLAALRGIKSAPTSPFERRGPVGIPSSPTTSPQTTQPQHFLQPLRQSLDPDTVIVVNGRPVLVTGPVEDFGDYEEPGFTAMPLYVKQIVAVSSFTDTVDTSHTDTSSSEHHDNNEYLPPLMERIEEQPGGAQQQPQQSKKQQQQPPPKQRRGMVRREFQRRILSKILSKRKKNENNVSHRANGKAGREKNEMHHACGSLT